MSPLGEDCVSSCSELTCFLGAFVLDIDFVDVDIPGGRLTIVLAHVGKWGLMPS